MKKHIPLSESLMIFAAVLIVACGSIWYGILQAQAPVVSQQAVQAPVIVPISLPTAYLGVQYYSQLQISDQSVSLGDATVATTSGQLPPGMTVQIVYPPCAATPPGSSQVINCPNGFVLSGTATKIGTYAFNVIFSVAGSQIVQPYTVQVLPKSQMPADDASGSGVVVTPPPPTPAPAQ